MIKSFGFYRLLSNLASKPSCMKSLSTIRSQHSSQTRFYSLYEPDYLESGKSQIPMYDVLNIQIKGYDYPILENYQKFIHNIVGYLDIEVEDCWATPAKHLHIQKYKSQSTVVDGDYKLSIYERNVQIADVPSTVYPVLLNVLHASLPEGVSLSVHEHLPEHEEIRYVPDLELKGLKSQLEDMGGPSKQKK